MFIDADKENYLHYYHQVLPLMASGGLILADNVLWSGKVVTQTPTGDVETRALQEFNNEIRKDPRVQSVLLPLRDGLMCVRVIG